MPNLKQFKDLLGHDLPCNTLCVTGVMCSGKTTLLKNIKELMSDLNVICEFIDPIPDNVLYTNTMSDESDQIEAQNWIITQCLKKEKLINQKRPNIIDRSWIDALVYSYVYGEGVFKKTEKLVAENYWRPKYYINLTAHTEDILKRAESKYKDRDQQFETQWKNLIVSLKSVNDIFAQILNIKTFNTSILSEENLCQEVYNLISKENVRALQPNRIM